MDRFWDLDMIGMKDKEISVYDKLLDVKFVNGAFVRLKVLKGRLDKSPNLIKQYDEFGIIEKVESKPTVGEVTYLPHRFVIREDRETTKVRVIFNGSAKV